MNGRPSHEHYKIEAITHPSSKTKYERKEMLLTRSKTSKFCLICKHRFLLFQNLLILSMYIFIIHG